jgi:hypothetical protein
MRTAKTYYFHYADCQNLKLPFSKAFHIGSLVLHGLSLLTIPLGNFFFFIGPFLE